MHGNFHTYKRQEMWQNKYSWNRNTKLEYLMYTKLFPYTKYVLHTYINSLQGVITMKYFLCNINEWSEFLEFYGIGVSKFAWIDLVIRNEGSNLFWWVRGTKIMVSQENICIPSMFIKKLTYLISIFWYLFRSFVSYILSRHMALKLFLISKVLTCTT